MANQFKTTSILVGLYIGIICSCFSTSSMAASPNEKSLVICTGQAFGPQWNKQINEFIQEVFAHTKLKPKVLHSPTKRAEHLFKNGACGGFFASSIDFPKIIGRKDIINVPESAIKIKVEAFLSPKALCLSENNCVKDLTNLNIVGLFRSYALIDYVPSITQASLVEVLTMEQGFKMLEKERISALIIPVVNANINNDLFKSLYDSVRVETIVEVSLYIWLEDKYEPYIDSLNIRVRMLKSTEKWKKLFD